MDYLTEANEQAVEKHVIELCLNLKALRDGSLGLGKAGIDVFWDYARGHFNQFGSIDLRRVIELVDYVKSAHPVYRDDFPHGSDKNLAWLQSVEDIHEASAEKHRRFVQGAAKGESTRDDSGFTLYERYNRRIIWLQQNNVRRPEEAPAPPPKELTEKEKAAAAVKADVDAIRSDIDVATKGHSQYAKNQNARLHKRFDELLSDVPHAKFFDRYGSQEWITGWPAVQRIIREEIRDANNPIR